MLPLPDSHPPDTLPLLSFAGVAAALQHAHDRHGLYFHNQLKLAQLLQLPENQRRSLRVRQAPDVQRLYEITPLKAERNTVSMNI